MHGLRIFIIAIVSILVFDQVARLMSFSIVAAAWADDDDDDNDDDDDDDDDRTRRGGTERDRPAVGSTILRNQPAPQRQPQRQPPGQAVQRPAPPPIIRLERAPNEIVTRDLTPEDTAALVAQGYVVLESVDLVSLATTLRRFQVPAGVSLEDARAVVRALPSGDAADFNHYYRAGQDAVSDTADTRVSTQAATACDGLHCPARSLINWPEGLGPAGCGAPVTIGMIDTGLNPDHEALRGANIDLTQIKPQDFSPSAAIHGTAVAALIVGDPATRAPGLLPGMPLVAVDAFHKAGGDERADAFTLVRALDLLSQRGVQVINLSLAGPANNVLEDTLDQIVTERGISVVAATGNAGPQADPAYPAAYDGVIAVTAVDRNGNAYRRAGRGAHVDLTALGVEVWTAASVEGARWKTGTSFAAPYVTAAVALWLQHDPTLTPGQITARLTASATDLGAQGRDDTYGYGLLDLGGTCPGQPVVLPVSAE